MSNASLNSKEHYDLMSMFEKVYKYKYLDREPSKKLQESGEIYQNGETNKLFIAFRHGFEYGKSVSP